MIAEMNSDFCFYFILSFSFLVLFQSGFSLLVPFLC